VDEERHDDSRHPPREDHEKLIFFFLRFLPISVSSHQFPSFLVSCPSFLYFRPTSAEIAVLLAYTSHRQDNIPILVHSDIPTEGADTVRDITTWLNRISVQRNRGCIVIQFPAERNSRYYFRYPGSRGGRERGWRPVNRNETGHHRVDRGWSRSFDRSFSNFVRFFPHILPFAIIHPCHIFRSTVSTDFFSQSLLLLATFFGELLTSAGQIEKQIEKVLGLSLFLVFLEIRLPVGWPIRKSIRPARVRERRREGVGVWFITVAN